MVCRQCGTEIADKAIICYKCGTAVALPQSKPARRDTGSRGGMLWAWVLIVAAVLAGLGWHLR